MQSPSISDHSEEVAAVAAPAGLSRLALTEYPSAYPLALSSPDVAAVAPSQSTGRSEA